MPALRSVSDQASLQQQARVRQRDEHVHRRVRVDRDAVAAHLRHRLLLRLRRLALRLRLEKVLGFLLQVYNSEVTKLHAIVSENASEN